jgi:hypothetical protein
MWYKENIKKHAELYINGHTIRKNTKSLKQKNLVNKKIRVYYINVPIWQQINYALKYYKKRIFKILSCLRQFSDLKILSI